MRIDNITLDRVKQIINELTELGNDQIIEIACYWKEGKKLYSISIE